MDFIKCSSDRKKNSSDFPKEKKACVGDRKLTSQRNGISNLYTRQSIKGSMLSPKNKNQTCDREADQNNQAHRLSSLSPLSSGDERYNKEPESNVKRLWRRRRIVEVNHWIKEWCHRQNFGFLSLHYLQEGLLAGDRLHLTRTGRNVFGKHLARLNRRAWN